MKREIRHKTYCKHYNGVMNTECDAGTCYEKLVGGVRPGWIRELPCIQENTTKYVCVYRAFPTPGETAEREKKSEERCQHLIAAIVAIKEETGGKRGVAGVIECPACKGALSYSIAECNGHIWGRCETEGCLAWMQ